MANTNYQNVGYSLTQGPLTTLSALPIVAKRAPTTADKNYQIGQLWVYVANNAPYILTSVVSNSATWQLIESSGGAGVFSSLTVSPGPTSITGTTNINTSGAGVTSINTGGTGALNLGNATGNTAVTGSLTTTTSLAATTTVTGGTGVVATTGNVSATAGAVNAGTSMTATLGNITATNGNVVLSTAATFVQLPGPIKIMSGAGAPSNGLAAEAGDLYINTTGSTTSTRLYIATGAGAWTFIASNA